MWFRDLTGFLLLSCSLSSVKLIDIKYLNLVPLYNINQIICVEKNSILGSYLDVLWQSRKIMLNTDCNNI